MTQTDYSILDWPRASGESVANYKIRSQPADFFVQEELSFVQSGEGEHVYLLLEKTGQNTVAIAERLAALAQVPLRNIGYAGLKDRHAVTRQWFSVQLPNLKPGGWQQLESDDLRLIKIGLHARKLKKGAVKCNRFRLLLKDVQGHRARINDRLKWIDQHGVPNYFGEQRFGQQAENVNNAVAWLTGKRKSPGRYLKGIYISSIRSYLYNQILGFRVADNTWSQAVAGDIFILNGSNSCFHCHDLSDEILQRIQLLDIHPALVLFGQQGGLDNSGKAKQLEQLILKQYPDLTNGLAAIGVKKAWRSSRLAVTKLDWKWVGAENLQLSFELPSGGYATSVLAEL